MDNTNGSIFGKEKKTCAACGREENLTTVTFYPYADRQQARTYMLTRDEAADAFFLSVCDDCGREKGKAPMVHWIWVLVGYLILGFGIFMTTDMHRFGLENSNGLPIIPMFLGYLIAIIAGIILVGKARAILSGGMQGLIGFLQIIPGVGLLALLLISGKINRGGRAMTALVPYAEEMLRKEKGAEEELVRRAESGAELSAEERQQLETYEKENKEREERKEYQRKAAEEQANRSSFRSAIIGICITVVIGLVGLSTYDSGRGYMTFFGRELSSTQFFILIGVLLVWDIGSIIAAVKKRNQ